MAKNNLNQVKRETAEGKRQNETARAIVMSHRLAKGRTLRDFRGTVPNSEPQDLETVRQRALRLCAAAGAKPHV